jgi:ribosomal protein L40E
VPSANLPDRSPEAVSAKRGERMTCVECGAEMGTARTCRRCGAPVLEHPQDQAPVPAPALVEAAESPNVLRGLAWIGVALLNLLALYYVIGSVVTGTEGSPAWGANYLPPWACAVIGFTGAMVPACTVLVVVRRRRRRVRERRAIASDSPEPIPESLD